MIISVVILIENRFFCCYQYSRCVYLQLASSWIADEWCIYVCMWLFSGLPLERTNTWPVCVSATAQWFHCASYCAL